MQYSSRQVCMSRYDSGFSAIELAIVMAIMAALVGLSAGEILPAMRRASINEAVALIEEANQRARLLSLRGMDGEYGVRIIDNGEARVQIVSRSFGATTAGNVAEVSLGGQAVFDVDIDDAAIIWLADTDLRSTAEQQIEWYYDSTGRLLHTDGNVSNVGIMNVDFSTMQVPWVGGSIGSRISPIALASASGDPGISVRTANDNYRIAISVATLGTFFDKEF